LTGQAAAVGEHQNIKIAKRFRRQQRLANGVTLSGRREVFFDRAPVYRASAGAGPQKYAGHGILSPSCSQILNLSCCHFSVL
jgi:hypothetical protein